MVKYIVSNLFWNILEDWLADSIERTEKKLG